MEKFKQFFRHNSAISPWFAGLMWFLIVLTMTGLILGLLSVIQNGFEGLSVYFLVSMALFSAIIVGAYMLIKAKKAGFYTLLLAFLVMIGINVFQLVLFWNGINEYDPEESEVNPGFEAIAYLAILMAEVMAIAFYVGQLITFLLIMLIKKDGRNVYQVLWGKKKAVEAEEASEKTV